MSQELRKEKISIEGMTCSGCENRIENGLKKIEGVESVKASTVDSAAEVVYDPSRTGTDKFRETVEKLGYKIKDDKASEKKKAIFGMTQVLGFAIILVAGFIILQNTMGLNFLPQITQNMSLGILFVVGLITSLHCIAMCGGINLSQCVNEKAETAPGKFSGVMPSLLYNAGRVVSYTVIGGIIGAVGSAFSFSPMAKGAIAIFAGIFMVIMGLNMLKAFGFLQKLNIRLPKFVTDRFNKIAAGGNKYGPFVVGLLNGLMPCGPLQAMQIYALGTGSFINGALSMFFFSLGTVPLLFTFGAASTFLSKKLTKVVFKFSGVLVILLGFFMLNNGFSLTGKNILPVKSGVSVDSTTTVSNNVQTITTEVLPNSFAPIRVVKGFPVRWVLHVKPENLNGCNNAIVVPGLGIQKKLEPGDNVIEFTPTETGVIPYSCWMGMIRSQIEVIDSPSNTTSLNGGTNGTNSLLSNNAGCCSGNNNPRFAGGKIPADNIGVAVVRNGVQEVTVNVDDNGYSPAVLVLQKNVPARIRFNPVKLSSCNYQVVFPEYRGMMDLSKGQLETPAINIVGDFGFQCGMGMLHGLVKVVDNLKKFDLDKIRNEVAAYRPANKSGPGGCCGNGRRNVN
jgi:uncharacterized protein